MGQNGFYDYYELLGLEMSASGQDIVSAYNRMTRIYCSSDSPEAENSSVREYFSEQELRELRRVLEQGFTVLSHPLKRAAYNESLKKVFPEKYGNKLSLAATSNTSRPESYTASDSFDGIFLRRIREEMNVSLEELSDATRIKPKFLNALESNDYDHLPAAVFVRGFVAQIAKIYGLDEQKVCKSYMDRFKEVRGAR